MAVPLSLDLRQRIAHAIETSGESRSAIARRFSVCPATVTRIGSKLANNEPLEAKPLPGRTPKVTSRHLEWIGEQLESAPYITSYELTERFNRHFRKVQVHRSTILRAMHTLGFSFKKNSVRPAAGPT